MKKLLWLLIFLFSYYASAQETFSSRKALNEYIFQKTDFNAISDGYFLNFDDELTPSLIDSLFTEYNQDDSVDINQLISFLKLIELSDVTHEFEADSLLFPVLSQSYINYGTNAVFFPIIIGDVNLDYLTPQKYTEFKNWSSSSAFPAIQGVDLVSNNIKIVGVCAKAIVNNDINLYWSDETVINNTGKIIERIELVIGQDTIIIPKKQALSISRYYNESTPLKDLKVKISYTDGSNFIKGCSFNFSSGDFPQAIKFSENKEKSGENHWLWEFLAENPGFSSYGTINGNVTNNPDPNELDVDFNTIPNLNFSVLWGCDPIHGKALDKPFIILGGWGPYTDRHIINDSTNWPETVEEQYYNFNQKGYIDSLVGYGYDVIVARFFPPNASILKNSQQLETFINLVNEETAYNNSYQENVISGYSAGSMCVRLTLERMEQNHLQDASNPHHHCKLYVSFDGEHGGANVPLALQHAVEYLMEYKYQPNNYLSKTNYNIYALHYILNAPLSRELLKYFHTATGNSTNPGQGADIARTNYLNYYGWYNHAKNTFNPGYPSFTRNISISNGTSVRTNGSSLSTYYPYHKTPGEVLFKTTGNNKFFEMYMLGNPNGTVFRYEKNSWGSWDVIMEAVTSNPLILDNAAGGTTPLADPNKCNDPNIMYNVLHLMKKKTPGTPSELRKEVMYTFTPTVLTHDIRNFSPTYSPNGGLMYYDMKNEGLMYQSINDIYNIYAASNAFGYPHLAHPSNHYTITPFDAIFSWDQENTVHLSSGHAYWENGGTQPSSNCNAEEDHKRWEEVDSPVREKMRSFLLQEADAYNAYIQNRHYGWNANPNYTYKADIVSKHNIYIGDSVSQRTDFLPVIIDANAEVRFIACNEVNIEAGFSSEPGATFSVEIDPQLCQFCTNSGLMQVNNRSEQAQRHILQREQQTTGMPEWDQEKEAVKLYPNPANNKVNLVVLDETAENFFYAVYDVSGKLIQSQNVTGTQTQLTLDRGVYFVQLKINESCYTKKLIMY